MKTRPIKTTLLAITFALLVGAQARAQETAAAAPQAKSEKSLYQRLGGYDAIAAVSDDFIQRLASDKRLSRFVVGLSVDSQKKLRQHLVDFLCEKTGGPCIYIGRDMKTSHTGLNITDDDWKAGGEALVATLDKFKVPQKEKDEVVSFVMSLKGDIANR
jgi:hemoglobin